MKKIISNIQGCCILLVLFVSLLSTVELRAEGVRASYLENSGRRSVLEIIIEDPAPSSVIVNQRIPEGVRIQNASPEYSKFSPRGNEAKWLFKRPVPGIQRIVLNYKTPLSGRGATAVIRCKSPNDGSLMTINVQ